MLSFYNIEGTEGAAILGKRLRDELSAGKRVLWLVCGGSSIPRAVEAMLDVPKELHAGLTIALTDERYGPVGHEDSNWLQLSAAGFEPGDARIIPTLQPDLSLAETAAAYAAAIEEALGNADIVIAMFGIGADGHIAGMLPGSPAVTEQALASGYDAGPFQRITLTPPALRRIAAAYAFVYGDAKRQALETLQQQTLPLATQPAQILKELPEAYIFNDQLGDTL